MTTFPFTIQTPTSVLFEGAVEAARLKTDLGRMEILPNHATLVGTLLYSKVYARHDGKEEVFEVRHGTVTVEEDGTATVLALEAQKVDDMTVKTMEDYLVYLSELLANPDEFNDYQKQFLEEQRQALEEGIADKQ